MQQNKKNFHRHFATQVRQMHIGLPNEKCDIETLKQHHVTS